jgi:hypothetical protein
VQAAALDRIDCTALESCIVRRMLGSDAAGCASENQCVRTSSVMEGTNAGITMIAVHSRCPGSSCRCMRSPSVVGPPQTVSVIVARVPLTGGDWTRG